VSDLEQAIDSWIEICEGRTEMRETAKSEGSTEKEKAMSDFLRDNLTKRLSKDVISRLLLKPER